MRDRWRRYCIELLEGRGMLGRGVILGTVCEFYRNVVDIHGPIFFVVTRKSLGPSV